MLNSFIKNPDLIAENSNVEDLFDFSKTITKFSNRLDSLEKSALIGLVGPFGSGKSTLLYQIQKIRQKKENWINFDAWKYPERRDLWEGFILEVAEHADNLKHILGKIEGKDTKSKSLDVAGGFLGAVIPGIGKLFDVFQSSPAKRVFQLQHILTQMINNMSKRVYIVVEDIDRSGDAGIFFLETLKQFLQNANLNRIVIVIVPISDKNFNTHEYSYYKCLDYNEKFHPKFHDFTKFVDTLFIPELFEGELRSPRGRVIWTGEMMKGQITSFCDALFREPSMSIRLMKTILRNANNVFGSQVAEGLEPDWRVNICFESAKYFNTDSQNKETLHSSFLRQNLVPNNTLQSSFLFSMYHNYGSVFDPNSSEPGSQKLVSSPLDFRLVSRPNVPDGVTKCPSWPWFTESYDKSFFNVCDFYLR